jgi:heme/copper-type cytochrome/quinol oxidase subunit 2
MNYVEQMQSLINKTIIDIVIIYVLIIIIIGVVWVAPFCYYKKKRDKRKNSKIFKKSLIAQASITVICLLFSLINISSFQDINNMKKDIDKELFELANRVG